MYSGEMKIEILAHFKHSDPMTNAFQQGKPGEVLIVNTEFGRYACTMGWAKDLDGKVETGKPKLNEVVLAPKSSAFNLRVENANG